MFSDRLKQLITHLKVSITSFETSIGVSKGSIAKPIQNGRNVGSDVVAKILSAYPNLNLEWLIAGTGEMMKESKILEDQFPENILPGNLITITKDEFIELQRKALRQEDRIRELEKVVEELRKG
ncbi:helix-turn-helix domain-containing protein [Dyadobacter sp. CY323]|uniref:helix-turn-helix domain-containing protein n=1 Tax=Dyadobacter sp. CY323 TaxID=2907302 RepID=UPI001F388F04|nr:helix-turn-helix domain-containing protein [Dyadobacter sp. CY323]MCE6990304.1 helix-turn-helix domain-containing protein [Dyadobacter sp. CY323]